MIRNGSTINAHPKKKQSNYRIIESKHFKIIQAAADTFERLTSIISEEEKNHHRPEISLIIEVQVFPIKIIQIDLNEVLV